MKTAIIYMYTSPSGKSYIGQTWNEERRKKEHNKHYSSTIFHSINDATIFYSINRNQIRENIVNCKKLKRDLQFSYLKK